MTDTPKPVRAWAAWHPKYGIDIGTIRESPGRAQREMTAAQCKNQNYSIVPVEIVPVKESDQKWLTARSINRHRTSRTRTATTDGE